MRVTVALLLLLPLPLLAQQAPPRFMHIYRDSLKGGVDPAYRAIEEDGARICVDLHCPNPYLGRPSEWTRSRGRGLTSPRSARTL